MPHFTLSCRNEFRQDVTLVYTTDSQHTPAFSLQGFPILGLFVPVCNGTPVITFELSKDGGATWFALKEADGSTAGIAIQAGAAAFAVSSDELGPLAAYTGGTGELLIRLVLSVAQTTNRTFTWACLS